MKQTVVFGSDHAGLVLKEMLKDSLILQGYAVEDVGTHTQESCHYPLFGRKVAQVILENKHHVGVLICGTGIGMSISANRLPGIQAALCHTEYEARVAREHNHANILCLGARVVGEQVALSILQAFLHSQPSTDSRHLNRVALMS
jgi:ribose 5-phosphate isomerase B